MNEQQLHEQASMLFLELRALDAGARAARLTEIERSDARLAAEVRSLLEHDVSEEVATLPTSAGGGEGTRSSGDFPAMIGPYTVLRAIGRGGSGYVLLAEQRTPVHRQVAIKIVPHAAISPDMAARFDFERRALERAEHPNIARILDAGKTPDGLPYLVMDYIEGVPINEYCDRHHLSVVDRIALVIDVANTVQHAHIRGVIHRDLKPANILVGDVAGKPTPRVLDFGIAKPTPDAADQDSPRTIGVALGTPAYMAPEQTGGHVVDTRADVYSLAAVLYELVSGSPPIRIARGTDGDLAELFRRIRDEIPAAASRVRSQSGDPRRTDSIAHSLMSDLDRILSKALEKQPDRRYATVAAFADDLVRLLRHEPITARPPTIAYRTARFCRRHRMLVAASGAVLLALVVGVAGLSWGLIEARRQRVEALNQTDAQRELNRFLTDDLLGAASPDQQGENITALELLGRASRRVESRLGDRPLIAAAVHHALGAAYMELGGFDDARRHTERALELRRAAAGVNAPETIHTEILHGSLLIRLQRMQEGVDALAPVIERARLVLGPDAAALYSAINDLGVASIGLNRCEQAVVHLKEALAGRARVLGARDPQVLVTTANLAQAFDCLGQTERSLEMQIDALRIAEGLEEQPKMTILGLCNNIGATYQDLDRDREAEPYLRRAAELAASWLGADNPATLTIQSNLAGLESDLGDPMRGAELYKKVADTLAASIGPDAMDTLTARYGHLNSIRKAHHFSDAAAGFEALLTDVERVLGDAHWFTAQTHEALARAMLENNAPDAAEPHAQEAVDRFLSLYGEAHQRTRSAASLLREIQDRRGAPAPDSP